MVLRPVLSCVRAPRASSSSIFSTITRLAMPLRAKILHPAFTQSMSSKTTPPSLRKNSDPDDVLVGSTYGMRTIELNRPAKHNSLNESMIRKIVPRLQEWEKSQLANLIVIKGAGEKAFCAGGDVAALAEKCMKGPEGVTEAIKFFALEYRLNHLIATYSKPYVAIMDGVTMGGGVGLSVHAPFRIATERTLFAMPETKIGFFPDVGGSFFLPRLDGYLGTYLALTSAPLKGVHTLYAGIATHYLHSSSLPDLEQRLSELSFADNASITERNSIVNATIEEFVTGLPPNEPFVLSGDLRRRIDRCFSHSTVPEILAALTADGSPWALETISAINARSPTAVHVALQQMRVGREWTIEHTFQREYHIAAHFMRHADFVNGVSSLLIRKDKVPPAWNPATVGDVKQEDVNAFFNPPVGARKLDMFKQGAPDFKNYPHAFGLPSEEGLGRMVKRGRYTLRELVDKVVDEWDGKEGVKQKVVDVVERRCGKDVNGYLTWDGRED
ncbi:ClpP/crotonase-like domain-containing protein [Tricharina praecox]|uniref:ClpP/crotonase-like domain-containing protein n=1 Tax=Tricharina praecox TaxID=43433 RepID=UPI00221E8C8B|nr:ClpP/crotonase-like domain-containing protein [Tricharina praecox]KAI5854552.1 ClpP/crotonase-like domain-containing protein [Tricharina praecox]